MKNPNAVQFDAGAGRDHVESYFLKLNEPTGDRALWLKATIYASRLEPDRPMAEGWAIAFDRRDGKRRHVAVKHVLPYSSASFNPERLAIAWLIPPPAKLSAEPETLEIHDGSTSGSIAHRDDRIAWDLRFEGEASPLFPLPFEAMYDPSVPTTKLVSPYPDLRFKGEATVNGERWSIDGWRGMQGHNWGRRHADLYAWSHANVWDKNEDFVLEGFSAQVKIGPLRTPLLTLVCARHRGVRYEWTSPIDIARSRGDVSASASARRWSFSASSAQASIEGELVADAEDMVGLYYPNPHGPMTYCLNTKIARARVLFEARGRPPLELTSRAAALEIGTRDEGHGVRMYV